MSQDPKCKSIQLPVTLKMRLVLILVLMLMFSFTSSAYASSTKRLAGQTRYDTAVTIAQDGWKQSDYAILAYGENYPDALSAAPLAKKYDVPILLTNGNNLPAITKETLVNLQVKNVFIIGGIGVIPSSIDSELQLMSISVTRIAGQDRYDTAIKVAQQLPYPTEIFVVTGEDYPDALSIAPIAAIKQEPIILVSKDYMPDSVKAYINANKITKTYVIGDTDVIDNTVFNQLPNAERIIGVDKYARNININLKFDNLFTSKDICVATGEGFADALTGTSYAAKKGIPIVLVNGYPSSLTRTYTVDKGDPYVFGGQAVVSEKVFTYLHTLPDTNITPTPTPDMSGQITAMREQKIQAPTGSIITLDGRIHNLIIELQIHKLRIEPESIFKSMVQGEMLPEVAGSMLTLKATQFNGIATQVLNGSIDDDTAIFQLQSLDTIVSNIDGTFTGWTGSTIFKLLNGQIWQQSSYAYMYHYAYSPKVTIYKSGLVYKMIVDGVDSNINVTRLK